jgi:hypothetical protein
MKTTEAERKYRNNLREITNAVGFALGELDAAMELPSTVDRGRLIARIANQLDLANDRALHFGLGRDFKRISKDKAEYQRLGRNIVKGAA